MDGLDLQHLIVPVALLRNEAKSGAMTRLAAGISSCFVLHFPKTKRVRVDQMKELNIREMRANLGRLDALVEQAGELINSRRGQPVVRVLPVSRRRIRPDHADLRRLTLKLTTASAVLIRAERDER